MYFLCVSYVCCFVCPLVFVLLFCFRLVCMCVVVVFVLLLSFSCVVEFVALFARCVDFAAVICILVCNVAALFDG